jgi:Family of unknown function (DUF5767)
MDISLEPGESSTTLNVTAGKDDGRINLAIERGDRPRVAPPPPPPPVSQRPRPTAPIDAREFRQTMEAFANPTKLKDQSNDDDDVDDQDDDIPVTGNHDGGHYEDDTISDKSSEERPYSVDEPIYDQHEEEVKPAAGFSSIDDEKSSLIFKLARARRSGMPLTKNWTMQSDIREMRAEVQRIEYEMSLDASLKLQKKILMAVVSGLEFLNRRYDPFSAKLDGWSESVHSSLDDFNGVFSRLYDKYKSKVAVAPEIELLMMLAGSALMFHFTKTMFGGALGSSNSTLSPDLMSNLMNSMMATQGRQQQTPIVVPQAAAPPPPPPPNSQKPQQRPEMNGPAFDISPLLGRAAILPPPLPSKSVSFADPPVQATTLPPNSSKRPREKLPQEDDDGRLSDIVSVSEMSSVPDLDPFSDDSNSEDAETTIKTIPLTKSKATTAKKTKTVLTL